MALAAGIFLRHIKCILAIMTPTAELSSFMRSGDLCRTLCSRLLHRECTFTLMALAAILDLFGMGFAVKCYLAILAAWKLEHVL